TSAWWPSMDRIAYPEQSRARKLCCRLDSLPSNHRTLTVDAPASPSLRERFWPPPHYLLLVRMRCVRHACHLGFSSVHENPGGRPKSSPPPVTQCLQTFEPAGSAYLC